MDDLHDETGLFGLVGHREAAHRVYLGLSALQHRGGRGAAMVVANKGLLRHVSGRGTPGEVFEGPTLAALPGSLAMGSVHAGGSGGALVFGRYLEGQLAVAMAGRLSNGQRLREDLKQGGVLLREGSDAEVVAHLIARSSKRTLVNRVVDALWSVSGAFSLLVATEDRLIAVRDPRGFRPLVYGVLDDAAVFASEDSALRVAGAKMKRELEPGQMAIAEGTGQALFVKPFPDRGRSACVQELATLAQPGSILFGQSVYGTRVALGERLAREQRVEADVVIGLGARGAPHAIGYAHVAALPYRQGLLDSAEGTLVEPPSGRSGFSALARFRPVPSVVGGQRVALILPTLATGSGVSALADLLRESGAVSIHLRVASPAVQHQCPYGVASPTREELASVRFPSLVDLGKQLGVDSVGFLTREGYHRIVGQRADGEPIYCDACLSGEYPEVAEAVDQLTLFE